MDLLRGRSRVHPQAAQGTYVGTARYHPGGEGFRTGSGRVSVAGLLAMRPGSRTRLRHRLRCHTGRKGERRSLSERDYIGLIDAIHQLVKAPIVLVRGRLSTHVSHAMRDLISARDWLTVFSLPAYAPELNAVEFLSAHVKRSLANLSSVALDRLEF